MPKVSVIVPVYKVEGYIERCARSLFAQTLEDLEIIFVDDGSPDRSIEIVERILEEYPGRRARTQILRLEHAGLAACRKSGIQVASGDFLIGCDSDDWVDPDMYASMLECAEAGGHDLVICDFVRETPSSSTRMVQPASTDPVSDILTGKLSPAYWNKLISRSLFTKDFVFPTADMNEDTVFSVQVAAQAQSIGYLQKAPYHYWRHNNSMINSHSKDGILNKWKESFVNAGAVLSFLEASGLSDKCASAIKQYKFSVRNNLAPLLLKREHYRQWRSTFPEIDSKFLADSEMPVELKGKYILSRLRIEPIYRRIYRLVNRNK